jgi:hypothetical protein
MTSEIISPSTEIKKKVFEQGKKYGEWDFIFIYQI